ncbi:MAG: PAS domain S-box protein, partial [Deltaproteobacteria bacterium]
PDTPLKILLIEDNPGDVRLIREMLTEAGAHDFVIEWVASLSQGLQNLVKDKVDLILLDLTLPDSHGLETFCKAYSLAPQIPFVLLTGLEDETLALTALQKGAQDYLVKGRMDGHTLVRAVRYAAERKKSQEDLRRAYDELERLVQARTAELVAANQQLQEEIAQRRQANAKLQALIEASPLAIFHVDPQGIIQGVNPAAERMFGWEADELLGQPLPMIPEDQWEEVLALRHRVFQGEQLTGLELRRRRKDGAWIDVSLSIAPMYDENGQVTGIAGLVEDITARKQSEAALAKSRAEFEAIFNSISDTIIFADHERRIILANPAVKTMFGYAPQELVGERTEVLYADRAECETTHNIYYPSGVPEKPALFEIIYRRKNGTLFSAESLASQVRDAQGNVLGGVGITRDITARKVAEAALQESQRQLMMLADFLENSSQPFWVGFLDGHMGMFNTAFQNLLGYTQEELSFMNWETDLTPAECRKEEAVQLTELHRTGQPVRYEKEFLRQDGRRVPVEMLVHLRRDEKGDPLHYYAFATDISARKEAEAALQESEALFRAIFEGAAIGIALTDTDGRILTINPAFEQSLGYCLQELAGTTFATITHADDISTSVEFLKELLAGRRDHYRLEKRYICKDGREMWVNLTVSLLRDATGAPKFSVGMVEDITARKEAETALERERQRLFALLDSLPGIILLHGEDYTVRFANRRFIEICGDPKNKLCYEAFEQRHSPCEACPAPLVIAHQTSQEWERQTKDGRVFQVYNYPFRDVDGSPCILTLGLDITARKQAEGALRKQAELLDLAHDAIIVRDLDSQIIFWSNGAEKTYGWTKEQAKGQFIHALLQTVFPASQEVTEREVLEQGKWEGELVHTRVDGTKIVVASRWALQRDDHGAPASILEINRDVTARKQVEEALQESETRFRQLAENIDDVFWLGSSDWRQTYYISPAYERVWGRSCASLYDHPSSWSESVLPEDRDKTRIAFQEQVAGDLPEAPCLEYRIKRPDGAVRWIQARFFPIRNEAGKVYRIAGIATDITSRKEVEAVLQWREEHLRQTAKMEAVGRLAGGVAHDFNNLLTIISGYGELVLADLQEQDQRRQQVQAILKAADQATAVTRQLLAFSRKQMLQPQILDLNRLITSLVEMLSRLVDEDIKISMVLEPELGAVKADPNHMEQVVMNLAINALDAMPQGGTLTVETANVQVEPDYTRRHPEITPGAYVVTTVADTGTGMNHEVLSHIFEPFFTTKEKGKGTGLGLSMAYGIIKQSGGHILVESAPQKGSVFHIYLPRVALSKQPDELAAPALTASRDTGTILLVEDEVEVRHVVRRMLALKGYSVLSAHDGQEALEIGQKHPGPIHLLLTDVAMPAMGGRELAERLASSHPEMKVLFMSGHTEDGMVRRGVRESLINFIQKPFRVDQLLVKVRKLLAEQTF